MMKIALNGAAGRMGRRILALAAESGRVEVAGAFDKKEDRSLGVQALSLSALEGKEKGILIDFSSPEGTRLACQAAVKCGWGLVVGTTGLDDQMREALVKASHEIPIVCSSNMSVGVNVLLKLLQVASRELPKEFSIQITETHHHHKKDAPSGTALMLAKQMAAAKGWDINNLLNAWTEGKYNEKDPGGVIKMRVSRQGEVVGDHAVLFSGPAETIEISHHADSRDTFARGALLAAEFLSRKPVGGGWYAMADVLSAMGSNA